VIREGRFSLPDIPRKRLGAVDQRRESSKQGIQLRYLDRFRRPSETQVSEATAATGKLKAGTLVGDAIQQVR